jgi:hypothetical protein
VGPLLGLAAAELRAMAAALRSGALAPGFSSQALARYTAPDRAAAVAEELNSLVAEEATSRALASFLERMADAREALACPPLDLVWSGPDTTGVASRDTAAVVRELFGSALRSVLVAGYAVAQGRDVFRVLGERMETLPELRVSLYLDVRRAHRDTTRSDQILAAFAQGFRNKEWPGRRLPEVYHDPRSLALDWRKRSSLHAKCIVIDSSIAFASSANFTAAAQERNIEVGVLVRDPDFAARLESHFTGLARSGQLVPVPGL